MPTIVKSIVAVALFAVVVTFMGMVNPRGQHRAFHRITFWRKTPEPTRRELAVRAGVNAALLALVVGFIVVMVYDVRPV
ncbi:MULTISPECIES: hypothetical protein [Kytococcus]|uniref:Uncharacterized protein n=1 Tax=Kytococcus schroeteri TaxID=138300 RepID=A0A2I1P9S5_9MICO|nr:MULTISPECIES: hypothetical protein [Kytococcus]OFS13985.1 hypothetical protein HMPREF3099_05080 [Kytococcus sp. HMSC28H12]PKZ41341.1 hypothetical protein CYJ76_07920 [Kytococcus schroeteri]